MRAAVNRPAPLWQGLPPAHSVAPLVFLIVILVPTFAAWPYGTLDENHAAWGLRALDWLGDRPPSRSDQVPPLFVACMAAALQLPLGDISLRLSLPSLIFGLLAIGAVFLLVRRWFSTGMALVTCVLLSVNEVFLEQTRQGSASTCTLLLCVLSLLFYTYHYQAQEETFSIWPALGGLALGALVLSSGVFALWIPLIALLHLAYGSLNRGESLSRVLRRIALAPSTLGGLVALGIALVLASPWLRDAPWYAGAFAPWWTETVAFAWDDLLAALPATIVVSAFAAWRTLRQAMQGGDAAQRAVFPLFWVLVAFLPLRLFEPTSAAILFAVTPLTILASRGIVLLADRSLSDRRFFVVLVSSIAVFVALRTLEFDDFARLLQRSLDERRLLEMHLALDIMIVVTVALAAIFKWSGRRESYRRVCISGMLFGLLILATIPGFLSGTRLPRRESPWLKALTQLERYRGAPEVVLVGPDFTAAPKPLRLALRLYYPDAKRRHVPSRQALTSELREVEARTLVLVVRETDRMPQSTPIVKRDRSLTLSKVYDSDEVIVYLTATAEEVKE